MIKIDGYLVNGRPDQTRVYDYADKNLRLTILKYDDRDYMRNCKHIKQAALYTLVWPEVITQRSLIYIGHTVNASKRVLQQIQKRRMFEDACVLTRMHG